MTFLAKSHLIILLVFAAECLPVVVGCGGSDSNDNAQAGGAGTGGGQPIGGSSGLGTSTNSGGTLASGGASSTAAGTGGVTSMGTGTACSPVDGVLTCGAPSACGQFVTAVPASGGLTPQGGTVMDGVYQLVQFYELGNASGTLQFRITKVIAQGTIASTSATPTSVIMSSGPYSVTGTMLTWTAACPGASTTTYSYTASSNQLTLYQTSTPGLTLVMVYDRIN